MITCKVLQITMFVISVKRWIINCSGGGGGAPGNFENKPLEISWQKTTESVKIVNNNNNKIAKIHFKI